MVAEALLFSVGWGSSPPYEIRLFGAGVTATKKGDFLFDELAAESVLAKFADSGMDRLPFDYAHGMLRPGVPEAHKAAGWFVPSVRDGELWATDIQWTEAAAAAIEAREFRFFSPAFNFDPETRRILELLNVALTNIPATKNQRPLVLDSECDGDNEGDEPRKARKMQVLLEALGCADEASAVARVVELSASAKRHEERAEALTSDLIKANAEIAALSAAREADAKAAKIEALCSAGKLPPSQVEFARGLTMAQLDAFASTLTSVVAAPIVEPSRTTNTAELSAVEREVCKNLGIDEATFRLGKVR